MYADRELRNWLDALERVVPGMDLLDGHVPVGLADPDVRIILAHCAAGCFGELVPRLHEVPNLFVDTSVWTLPERHHTTTNHCGYRKFAAGSG